MIEGFLVICVILSFIVGFLEGKHFSELKWIEKEALLRSQIRMQNALIEARRSRYEKN